MGIPGAPLYDLAVLLSYRAEKDDPPLMHEMRQMPSPSHGLPPREQVADEYSQLAGTPMTDFIFFVTSGELADKLCCSL